MRARPIQTFPSIIIKAGVTTILVGTLIDVQPVSVDALYVTYDRNLFLLLSNYSVLVSIHYPILDLLVEVADFSFGYVADILVNLWAAINLPLFGQQRKSESLKKLQPDEGFH
jgi:hypothetical protein